MKLISECQQEPELLACSSVPVKEPLHLRTSGKSVTFSATLAQVKDVLSVKNYTNEEIHASWYNKSDYKNFKRSVLTTLKLNRAGELPKGGGNDEHTMRGIECRTREGAAEHKAVKAQVKTAVLEEQQRQQSQGVSDPELLALLAQQITADQQHQAFIHGMCDELEARDYLNLAQAVSQSNSNNHKMSSTMPRRTVRLQDVASQSGLKLVAGQAA